MTKIVAIGGGEIGGRGLHVETTKIDKEIILLSGKKHPKLLFIPTASYDSKTYYENVQKHFGKRLGCKTDVLYLKNEKLSKREIEGKILSSDIIYVGGGDTETMMKVWRKTGTDKILKKAYKRGIVLSGLSAGAICWFKYGNSDSRMIRNPNADMIKVRGLGLVNALFCPHYRSEKNRKADLKKMMKKQAGIAIAVDNCCAIEILEKQYRIIRSKGSAKAYKVYWKADRFCSQVINNKEFISLGNLLKK
ncbi:MAG: peptidase E [Phycisphaerales bacterium]